MEAINKGLYYNHLLRGPEYCTYQDMADMPLSHLHGDKIEDLINQTKVGNFKNGKLKISSNVIGYEIINSIGKNIRYELEKDYEDKIKYTIMDFNKYKRKNSFLNFYSKYEILVLTADDSDETLIALINVIEKKPINWIIGIVSMLFVPFIAVFEIFKLFFKILFFIEDQKLWSFIFWMIIVIGAGYYMDYIMNFIAFLNETLIGLNSLGVL